MERIGTDINKADPLVCMAVGCARKAIYINPHQRGAKSQKRGYCSLHKSMAVPTKKGAANSSAEWVVNGLGLD